MSGEPMLLLSLRECRLILERLVQAAGAPPGLLHAVRDCALYSAILPGPGLAAMAGHLEALRASKPLRLALTEKGDRLVADANGQHAWYAAPTILDLAVARYRLTGIGNVVVENLAEPGELRIVAGLAEPYGLLGVATPRGDAVTIAGPRPAEAATALECLRRDGLPTPAAVWWPLYHASHAALAPDTFESRRHAGTVRVEADGRIVGRNDEDETDLSMLTPDPSLLHY